MDAAAPLVAEGSPRIRHFERSEISAPLRDLCAMKSLFALFESIGGMNGAGECKKNGKSKFPHARPAYGAPKFVLGLIVRATRLAAQRRASVRTPFPTSQPGPVYLPDHTGVDSSATTASQDLPASLGPGPKLVNTYDLDQFTPGQCNGPKNQRSL
jgi:hypothetical protein